MSDREAMQMRLLKRAHAEIVERDECIARLRVLVERSHHALLDAYLGGEWGWYVPDDVTLAAAKEQHAALELVDEIRKALGWPAAADEFGKRREARSEREWQLVSGTAECDLGDGWRGAVTAYDGGYHWTVHHASTGEYGVGLSQTWALARQSVLATRAKQAV